MNLTNNSNEYDHEKNSSTDDEEEDNRTDQNIQQQPSICIENFFSDNEEELDSSDDDDDDDNGSDIENHYYSNSQLPTENRLCSLLRQSNRLVELKLNLVHNQHQSLRHALSDSDMSKHSYHYQSNQQEHNNQQSFLLPSFSSNHFYLSTNQSHRLYLSSTTLYDIQTHIINWLQASTYLIDSISKSNYHRQCWSQLLLTYFIEKGYINFEFLRCTHSVSLTTVNNDSMHKHGCVPEEDAYKLCSVLQKGARFNINSIILDHIRRIIVIKSIQEVGNVDNNLQEAYVKQLKSLKQSLIHQQSSVISINNSNPIGSVASIYSKLLLFLSSLYSIKAETMQILFCQHLQHNPNYSYLVTS